MLLIWCQVYITMHFWGCGTPVIALTAVQLLTQATLHSLSPRPPSIPSLLHVYSNLCMYMYATFFNGGRTLWVSILGQPPNHDQHFGLGHRPTQW